MDVGSSVQVQHSQSRLVNGVQPLDLSKEEQLMTVKDFHHVGGGGGLVSMAPSDLNQVFTTQHSKDVMPSSSALSRQNSHSPSSLPPPTPQTPPGSVGQVMPHPPSEQAMHMHRHSPDASSMHGVYGNVPSPVGMVGQAHSVGGVHLPSLPSPTTHYNPHFYGSPAGSAGQTYANLETPAADVYPGMSLHSSAGGLGYYNEAAADSMAAAAGYAAAAQDDILQKACDSAMVNSGDFVNPYHSQNEYYSMFPPGAYTEDAYGPYGGFGYGECQLGGPPGGPSQVKPDPLPKVPELLEFHRADSGGLSEKMEQMALMQAQQQHSGVERSAHCDIQEKIQQHLLQDQQQQQQTPPPQMPPLVVSPQVLKDRQAGGQQTVQQIPVGIGQTGGGRAGGVGGGRNKGQDRHSRVSHHPGHPNMISPNKTTKKNTCINCNNTKTVLWRRDGDGNSVCNPCGLYYKLHKKHRPSHMKKEQIQKRNRKTQGTSSSAKARRKQREMMEREEAMERELKRQCASGSSASGSANQSVVRPPVQVVQLGTNVSGGQVSPSVMSQGSVGHCHRSPSSSPPSMMDPYTAPDMIMDHQDHHHLTIKSEHGFNPINAMLEDNNAKLAMAGFGVTHHTHHTLNTLSHHHHPWAPPPQITMGFDAEVHHRERVIFHQANKFQQVR